MGELESDDPAARGPVDVVPGRAASWVGRELAGATATAAAGLELSVVCVFWLSVQAARKAPQNTIRPIANA